MILEDSDVIPRRSTVGAAAEDMFYASFNDVSFYVEDRDQENLYLNFLRSGFPELSIEKIFPLDGKKNVLKHFDDPVNNGVGRRIYILDKDFDDLLGRIRNEENIIYLDKFCLENYVVNLNGIAELVREDVPKLKITDVIEQLTAENLPERLYVDMRKLSFAFYLVQKYNADIVNVGGGVFRYAEKPILDKIDIDLERKYLELVVNAIPDPCINIDIFDTLRDPSGIDFNIIDKDDFICGKHIIGLLIKFCKHYFGISASVESATYRLSQKVDMANFSPVISKIRCVLEQDGRIEEALIEAPASGQSG